MDSTPEKTAGSGPPRERRGVMSRVAVVLATAGGVGYAPRAPGTFGTAVAVPLVWLSSGLPQWAYVALCAAVTLVAIWAAHLADRAFGEHDAGKIVIDEVAGYFWTMVLVARSSWPLLAVGFVLFRAADILKPPPARALDRRMPGGPGVVLDDVAAGVWAAVGVWLIDLSGVLLYMTGP